MSTTSCQPVEYGGWKNCLKLSNGTVELVVTLDVGPRVIRYGLVGGTNLFKEFPARMGLTAENAGSEWADFGGHRLWHAPEVVPRTYALDYEPVEHTWQNGVLTLTQRTEATTGIQKVIHIRLLEDRAELQHVLINHNLWSIEAAPWCLSVMAAGGRLIAPQEEYIGHPEALFPARRLVLWHYTKMDDPRYTWGERFIQMRQDDRCPTKQKFGMENAQGWVAYHLGTQAFVKTFDYRKDQTYPDYGCNCEFFTMPGFLEVETLGPSSRIEPGASVAHRETWYLFDKVSLPAGDAELVNAMQPIIDSIRITEGQHS